MTAKLYEDVGLLTADPDITADVADLFNYLTGYSRQQAYRRILVAPITLRSRHPRADPPRGRGAGRSHRDEDEQPRRRRDDRRAVRGLAGGHRDRPDRPRHLLPAARRARSVGATSASARSSAGTSSIRGSSASGARTRGTQILHRLGRPHAAQPGPPGRVRHRGPRPRPAGPSRGDPRRQPGRRRARLGARPRGVVEGARPWTASRRTRTCSGWRRNARDDGVSRARGEARRSAAFSMPALEGLGEDVLADPPRRRAVADRVLRHRPTSVWRGGG